MPSPVKGIVHRYADRVLLKALHACPVYCRFCFRREQVGPGGEALDGAELAAALDYIRARPQVWEVILTGGDPLMLAPRRLAKSSPRWTPSRMSASSVCIRACRSPIRRA